MSAGEVIHTSNTGGQKAGNRVRMSLIPTRELMDVAELFGKGAEKYDEHNWTRGYKWSLSYDAMHRHLAEFWAGNELDDGEGGTGLSHLACAAFHVLALMYFAKHHRDFDDRHVIPVEDDKSLYPDEYYEPGQYIDQITKIHLSPNPLFPQHPGWGLITGRMDPLDLSAWKVDDFGEGITRATRLTSYLTDSKWESETSGFIYWFVDGDWWYMDPKDDSEDPWFLSTFADVVGEEAGPFVLYDGPC